MSAEAARRGGVLLFLLRFALVAALALGAWWQLQPYYVEVAGQAAGLLIRYGAGFSVTGMDVLVDPTGVLNTKTSLRYHYQGRPVEIEVAFLVANLPAYIALVLATGGIGWRRRGRALGIGSAILAAGHVLFLTLMFIFSREAREAPDLPTVFGLFVMTLPFPLWIALAYWERVEAWMHDATLRKSRPAE